jgi:hypothetical protein
MSRPSKSIILDISSIVVAATATAVGRPRREGFYVDLSSLFYVCYSLIGYIYLQM